MTKVLKLATQCLGKQLGNLATSFANTGSESEEGDGDEPRKPKAGWEKIVVDLEEDERKKQQQGNEDDRRAGKNRKRQKMEVKQAIAA